MKVNKLLVAELRFNFRSMITHFHFPKFLCRGKVLLCISAIFCMLWLFSFFVCSHLCPFHSICSWAQHGSSSPGDCHQPGTDWSCGGPCLLPQTPVLPNCGLPHQEQSQHGGKTICFHPKLFASSTDINFFQFGQHVKLFGSVLCIQVLYIQAFVLVFLLGKFMRKVFFGQLRAAEMEVELCFNFHFTHIFTVFYNAFSL